MIKKQTADWDKILTRDPELFIFSYGAPRSGTTFIQYVLNQGRGYYYNKLKEQYKLHPCNSSDGLIQLQQAITGMNQDVVFIRTYRHPFKIFESFKYARIWEQEKFGADKVGPGVGGLSSWTDEFIIDRMLNEYRNTMAQSKKVKIAEIRYEGLYSKENKQAFINLICDLTYEENREILTHCMSEFSVNSVREGRLKHLNYEDGLLTDGEKDFLYDKLKELFEGGNYEKI